MNLFFTRFYLWCCFYSVAEPIKIFLWSVVKAVSIFYFPPLLLFCNEVQYKFQSIYCCISGFSFKLSLNIRVWTNEFYFTAIMSLFYFPICSSCEKYDNKLMTTFNVSQCIQMLKLRTKKNNLFDFSMFHFMNGAFIFLSIDFLSLFIECKLITADI